MAWDPQVKNDPLWLVAVIVVLIGLVALVALGGLVYGGLHLIRAV
jgi:hypothetical protein